MSAYSAEELALLGWLESSIPRWLWLDDQAQEAWAATVKSLRVVQDQIKGWNDATFILSATDIWLNQHAKDRGTTRQNTETDAALQGRLRNPQDALTRATILNAVQTILTAQSIAGTPAMVELPRDCAALGTFTADTGTGGTVALVSGTTFKFTPTVPFAAPPYLNPALIRMIQSYSLTIAGAGNAGNNGTFTVTGLDGAAAKFTNASGVAAVEAGATWTVNKLDRQGNAMNTHGKSFCSRGFRVTHAGTPSTIVIILPYGSNGATVTSVRAMLQQKKAAGFLVLIESRANP